MTEQLPQMSEEGLVRELKGGLAMVETVQTEACTSCSAKGACQAMGGTKTRLVPAINEARASEGDRVLLATPRRGVLGAGFLLYIVPVAALIGGAGLGQVLARAWGWDPQALAVLVGALCLTVCWLGLRALSRRLGRRQTFAVKIVRVLRKGNADAVEQCSAGL